MVSSTKRASAFSEGTGGGPEKSPFRATPETISQYLKLKTDEVIAQMKSVNGRQALFDKLMKHREALQKIHAFDPAELRRQLEVAGEAVVAKERYMKDMKSPEKKGLMQRAWEKVKAFPRRHPIVTALLIIAAAAGGMYLLWNYMGSVIPVPNPMEGAAGVAKEGIPPVGPAFRPPPVDIVPPNLTTPPYPNPVPGAVPEVFAPPVPRGINVPIDLYPPGYK